MKFSRPAALPLLIKTLRLLRRRRRLISALLFCTAAAIAVSELTPVSPLTELVLTVNQDLPSGTVLKSEQLTEVRLPPEAVPDSAFNRVEQASGGQLTAPVRRGQVLTDASLVGEKLLVGAPPGNVAVPLRVSDPSTTRWLAPGQLVNVLLSPQDASGGYQRGQLLAQAIPVLWIPAKADAPSTLLTNKDDSTDGLVLVSATAQQSTALATAASRGKVSLVLVTG
ncbi:RcpC/CpaB family pilus assembly protein [Psychromicrobium sp. YIM B11713]|uniref:RcpC/CpaB family pilus assembly protein n=1 Tax=Psychromicrobium sp. YIM B11713 TaxID=3145233 RepID=UPI00374E29EC